MVEFQEWKGKKREPFGSVRNWSTGLTNVSGVPNPNKPNLRRDYYHFKPSTHRSGSYYSSR